MSKRRRTPRWLIAVVVLGLLIGGLWRVGGFEPTKARRIAFTPGDKLELGPITMIMSQARAASEGGDGIWTVRVEGTCQGNDPAGFMLFDKQHWLFGMGSNTDKPLVANEYIARLSPDDRSVIRTYLAADLPPMPCHVESKMPKGFDPKTGIIFAVQSFEWRDNSILKDRGEAWHSGRDTYRTTMPVTVVDSFYR